MLFTGNNKNTVSFNHYASLCIQYLCFSQINIEWTTKVVTECINHWDHPAQKGNSDIELEIPPNFTKVKSALLHLKKKSAEQT
jgi:hypothetical protein